MERAQIAGLNMSNMSGVTFQHCTFSQCSREDFTSSDVPLKSDQSKDDIINFKESSSVSPNLQRADSAGLSMSNMREVTFQRCTFSIPEELRAQSAGISMSNMSQVTFDHCTFSQVSLKDDDYPESIVSLKSDQSKDLITNFKESSSPRICYSQLSPASCVSYKSDSSKDAIVNFKDGSSSPRPTKLNAGDHDVVKQKDQVVPMLPETTQSSELSMPVLPPQFQQVCQKRKSDHSQGPVDAKKSHLSANFTSSSEEDVGPGDDDQDEDLRGDVTSDCPGV